MVLIVGIKFAQDARCILSLMLVCPNVLRPRRQYIAARRRRRLHSLLAHEAQAWIGA